MGIWNSSFVAYGVEIEEFFQDELESASYPEGVGYLQAGSYDRDRTFIVTYCESAELGEVHRFDPASFAGKYAEWNTGIQDAAASLGVELTEDPSWFVVPDQS